MDRVKEFLAVACLAYGRGDPDFAVRAFLQGMEAAHADSEGLENVVRFLRPPVAAINSDVPVSENTLAPSLKGVPLPTTSTIPENGSQVLTLTSAVESPVKLAGSESNSSSMLDEGDVELEARAETENDIDDDEDDEDEESDEDSDESEDDDEEMQLSISSSTPIRLKQ
jgi:hypothetical protein